MTGINATVDAIKSNQRNDALSSDRCIFFQKKFDKVDFSLLEIGTRFSHLSSLAKTTAHL